MQPILAMMAAHRTERLKPESANYSTERYRAGHYRFLVVLPTVLDLLIFAKHLFVGAGPWGFPSLPPEQHASLRLR